MDAARRRASGWCTRRRRGTGCTATTATNASRPRSHRAAPSRSSGTRVASGRARWAPTTTPRTPSTHPTRSAEPTGTSIGCATGIARAPAFEPPDDAHRHLDAGVHQRRVGALLGTHSDHRILPEEQRARLHARGRRRDRRHGGRVDVVYDVESTSVGESERDRGPDPRRGARGRGRRQQRADERADARARRSHRTGRGTRASNRTRR